MNINDRIKSFIRSWLNVQESNYNNAMMIQIDDDLRVQQLMWELWYSGEPGNLQQFFQQYDDKAGNSMFWKGIASNPNMPIRKIHTGLPSLIIDKIADIVVDDMSDIVIYDGKTDDGEPKTDYDATKRWNDISKEHDFKKNILKEAVRWALLGDAVFKISYDSEVSQYPIIEVYKGRDVDFNYKRGRFIGADFMSHKLINKKNYFLKETYQRGNVIYTLFDEDGKDVSAGLIEDLYELYPFEYTADFIMAIPLIIDEDSQHKGRGKSILSGKSGSFDSLDETWSQWMDAIRAGRTNRYIPENLIPKDPNTGALVTTNAFDNQFKKKKKSIGEDKPAQIQVESPDIRSEKYLSAYVTALDLCLQGVVSPSTLGIDVKKLDNAEAQREKEKTTQYTYNKVVEVLEKVIPTLVETVLKIDDVLKENEIRDYEVSVMFGGYANPSFEAKVETVGNARTQGIMSLERAVEELYGDSLTKEEKAAEVKLLKIEQGYLTEEPSTNQDIQVTGDFDSEIETNEDGVDVEDEPEE